MSATIFDRYKDFEIRLGRQAWGIKLEVRNAPSSAFVDGQMIRGIKEHLFAVLRDIVYIHDAILGNNRFDLNDPVAITNAVYHILRNARILDYKGRPDLVVCWGGHSIGSAEYDYTKKVGYELGLRALSVCTGCGPGAMKGPMKGATIGHAKQRIRDGRYIGMTEPGHHCRRAAESDRESARDHAGHREAPRSVRAHGACHRRVSRAVPGTAEEILYLLGILLDPANAEQPLPVDLHRARRRRRTISGRSIASSRRRSGAAAQKRYKIVIGDPGAGGARSRARHRSSPRIPPCAQRCLQLQLAAEDSSRISSGRSNRRTRRWRSSSCGATWSRMCWPRTCAARSPASSPAT